MSTRMRNKKRKLRNIDVGEISALRDTSNTFVTFNGIGSVYQLDSSKVNCKLARQMYNNSHDLYKLGAGFVKPIINSIVGFMGNPTFNSKDSLDDYEQLESSIDNPENTEKLNFSEDLKQDFFDDFINKEFEIFQKIHKNTLRDGDCYLMLIKKDTSKSILYDTNELLFTYKFIDPLSIFCVYDSYDEAVINKAIISTKISYTNENNNFVSYTIVETWTDLEHSIKYTDMQNISGLVEVEEKNPFGFVPIIKFSNERDFSLNGSSEIEPVEPYIRAYNDVMLDYLRTNRLTAQPKLKVRVSDINTFLSNNFTSTEIASKQLSLSNKNVIFLGSKEDDAGYLEVSATNHFTLLEFLFMCIVDVSETPEFVFGTAVASSKASVSEQMIPVIKKVERKRASLKNSYDLLIRMLIAFNNISFTKYGKLDFKYDISWKEIDREDDNTKATTIKTLIEAYTTAISEGIMAKETAVESLSKLIDEMGDYKKELLKIKNESKDSNNNDDSDLINSVIDSLQNNNIQQNNNVNPNNNNNNNIQQTNNTGDSGTIDSIEGGV